MITKKGKIFITGEILGADIETAKVTFATAKENLLKQGWDMVINPMDALQDVPQPWKDGFIKRNCRRSLKGCRAIYVLPSTEKSQSAQLDLDYAVGNNLDIYYELQNVEENDAIKDIYDSK